MDTLALQQSKIYRALKILIFAEVFHILLLSGAWLNSHKDRVEMKKQNNYIIKEGKERKKWLEEIIQKDKITLDSIRKK